MNKTNSLFTEIKSISASRKSDRLNVIQKNEMALIYDDKHM